MNINDIKFDHFKNIEELIQHLEMWYAEDDYDAYNRFFGLRDARIMGMIIYQLTNNWNELEDILKIKKARMLNEPDYSKYYVEGYETAIQATHSSHSGIMLETAKKSIVVLCDELLDKMKEIKEKSNGKV